MNLLFASLALALALGAQFTGAASSICSRTLNPRVVVVSNLIKRGLEQRQISAQDLEGLAKGNWYNPFSRHLLNVENSAITLAFDRASLDLIGADRDQAIENIAQLLGQEKELETEIGESRENTASLINPRLITLDSQPFTLEANVSPADLISYKGRPAFVKRMEKKGGNQVIAEYMLDPFNPRETERTIFLGGKTPELTPHDNAIGFKLGAKEYAARVDEGLLYDIVARKNVAKDFGFKDLKPRRHAIHTIVTKTKSGLKLIVTYNFNRLDIDDEIVEYDFSSRGVGTERKLVEGIKIKEKAAPGLAAVNGQQIFSYGVRSGMVFFSDISAGLDLPVFDVSPHGDLTKEGGVPVFARDGKAYAAIPFWHNNVKKSGILITDVNSGKLERKLTDLNTESEVQVVTSADGRSYLYFWTKWNLVIVDLQTYEVKRIKTELRPDTNIATFSLRGEPSLIWANEGSITIADLATGALIATPIKMDKPTKIIPFSYGGEPYAFLDSEEEMPALLQLTEKVKP